MRAKDFITELADAPAPLTVTGKEKDFISIENRELNLVINFLRHYGTNVSIQFAVDDDFELTGAGNQYKILSTVHYALKKYLNWFLKPYDTEVSFSADRLEPSRVSLYNRIAPRYITPILGPDWKFSKQTYRDEIQYVWERDVEDLDEIELEEGWKNTAAALGMAGALTAGSFLGGKQAPKAPQAPTNVTQQITKAAPIKQQTPNQSAPSNQAAPDPAMKNIQDYLAKNTDANGTKIANVLIGEAIKQGIKGDELLQLVIQAAHETKNFTALKERGTDKYFTKLYDRSKNPRKAKILGNTKVGDGAKFCGRGFLHLTGRDVAARAGNALGIPELADHPELMERPDIAAKTSVWFWKTRVRAKAADPTDLRSVTKVVNPGMKGMKLRQQQQSKITGIAPTEKRG